MSGPPAGVGQRRDRRYDLWFVLGLLLLGAALVLLASGRTWWSAAWQPDGFPAARLARSGRQVAPGAWACGILGLAGVVGVLATRRVGRIVTGAVLVLAGLSGAAVSAAGWLMRDAEAGSALAAAVGGPVLPAYADRLVGSPWPLVSIAGGLAIAAGGALTCLRGRHWPAMGSRYDAPAGRSPDGQPTGPRGTAGGRDSRADAWAALDRGEDPTV